MTSRTVTAVLAAPKEQVFDYLSKIENLPSWASEFARELKYEDGKAKIVNGLGEFYFVIEADAETGVIDMYAGPTEDELGLFPTRVVGLPGGTSAFSFTMFQAQGMPDELFESQYQSLLREIENIRQGVRRVISTARVDRDDLGFLLAKATQRWNELLAERFAAQGYGEVRPSYGSVLLPLYEEDGLRMSELAARARLSKQTMTRLIARLERDRLVERRADPSDGRAALIYLTKRARRFEPVAAVVLAELDRLVKRRLSSARVAVLKDALRELMDVDAERSLPPASMLY